MSNRKRELTSSSKLKLQCGPGWTRPTAKIDYFAICLLMCVVLLAGCYERPTLVEIRVPIGYHGPIAIVSHTGFAASIRPDAGVIEVPSTAVACVRSDRVFKEGFHLRATYADGSRIFSSVPQPETSDSIRIRAIGVWLGSIEEEEGIHWLAVGTEAEVATMEQHYKLNQLQVLMPSSVSIDREDDFEDLRRYCESDSSA